MHSHFWNRIQVSQIICANNSHFDFLMSFAIPTSMLHLQNNHWQCHKGFCCFTIDSWTEYPNWKLQHSHSSVTSMIYNKQNASLNFIFTFLLAITVTFTFAFIHQFIHHMHFAVRHHLPIFLLFSLASVMPFLSIQYISSVLLPAALFWSLLLHFLQQFIEWLNALIIPLTIAHALLLPVLQRPDNHPLFMLVNPQWPVILIYEQCQGLITCHCHIHLFLLSR